jgi:hypothetical protein
MHPSADRKANWLGDNNFISAGRNSLLLGTDFGWASSLFEGIGLIIEIRMREIS